MKLPDQKVSAEIKSPRRTILIGLPKVGKTTALAHLEDNLIIDLEQGTKSIDALKVEVNNLEELRQAREALYERKEQKGDYAYTYGTLDTVTALEDMVMPLAVQNYKNTIMGQNFKGDDVTKLPNGAGYKYLREAFFQVINGFQPLFKYLILTGHVKDKLVTKQSGDEVDGKALDLTGKISSITCSKADAIGYMYRGEENKLMVTFKANEETICGARNPHLRGKEFVLSQPNENEELTFNWNQIFID